MNEEGLFLSRSRLNNFRHKDITNKPEDPKKFLERYNITFCPFHRKASIKNIEVDITHLTVDSIRYDFGIAECVEGCRTPVSFDDELIRIVSSNIQKVEINDGFDRCVVCGGDEGGTYRVGSRSPYGEFKTYDKKDGLSIYLAKKTCGHNYVFMKI